MEWPASLHSLHLSALCFIFPSGKQVSRKNTDISKGYQRSGKCADNMLRKQIFEESQGSEPFGVIIPVRVLHLVLSRVSV